MPTHGLAHNGVLQRLEETLVLGAPLCFDGGGEGVGIADHRAEPPQREAQFLGVREAGRAGGGQEIGGLIQQAVELRGMIL
jgi:hypothetical protein